MIVQYPVEESEAAILENELARTLRQAFGQPLPTSDSDFRCWHDVAIAIVRTADGDASFFYFIGLTPAGDLWIGVNCPTGQIVRP